MRIAYSKLGRSMLLDPEKWGAVGGDNEPLHLLETLAHRNPDVEWVVAGKHGGDPGNLPKNVVVPEIPKGREPQHEFLSQLNASCDGAVSWLGQHGTSNQPIPQDKDPSKVTKPQESFMNYAGHIIHGFNMAGDEKKWEPVWLCADPRNYLKARDLKWYPWQPILGQYNWERTQRHYRWGDERTPEQCGRDALSTQDGDSWKSKHSYIYSGLELTGIPPAFEQAGRSALFDERPHDFGIVINEARGYVNPMKKRSYIVRDWVKQLNPGFIHGKWSKTGLEEAQYESIEPVHYMELANTLASAKTTFTTPSSGSEWATAKPWECFALGVICFFHPLYDTQGHIVPTLDQIREAPHEHDDEIKHLAWWLRPRSPSELRERVAAVASSRETYEWLAFAQLALLDQALEEQRCVNLIEQRLGLPGRVPL